jgi:hypothetical protein
VVYPVAEAEAAGGWEERRSDLARPTDAWKRPAARSAAS